MQQLREILIVGAGGFIGSAFRYMFGGWVQRLSGSGTFPFGTLGVNIAGCLLIGVLGGLAENREVFRPATRLFLMLGVLGGFTTFSTFGYETLALLRDQEWLPAVGNIALQVFGGLAAVWAGYALSNL
jgi:fluoride exporter